MTGEMVRILFPRMTTVPRLRPLSFPMSSIVSSMWMFKYSSTLMSRPWNYRSSSLISTVMWESTRAKTFFIGSTMLVGIFGNLVGASILKFLHALPAR